VKAAVNGPEATALGASSAFKNEAAAGLRRASVSGRRWRGAVANKRRQVQVRGQSRSAGSSAGSSVAAQRQLSGQLWADDGTPRPNSARQQLGCRRRAAGGRRGPPHSTPTKPSPLDPSPLNPSLPQLLDVHAHCTLQIRASPASHHHNGPLPACPSVTLHTRLLIPTQQYGR
jgi:hypothetical protein